MKSVSDKKPDRLNQLADPVSALKIDKNELKSSSDTLANVFVGDSVDCDVAQSSRPSWKSNHCLTFGTDDEATSCDDIWAKKNSSPGFKIVLLKNLSKSSLAEISPKPNGNWTFSKYSVSDGSEISNGVTNVFNGKFLILNRKIGFIFPGQVLGVCQFIRPSVGKSQCSAPCLKEFHLSTDFETLLQPNSTSIITMKIDETDRDSFKNCHDSNHILRATKMSISNLVVIDGYSDASLTMKFVIRNVSNDVVQISSKNLSVTVTCCFNEKEFQGLLSRPSNKSSFNWDKQIREKKLPSNHVDNSNKENNAEKKDAKNEPVVKRQNDFHKISSDVKNKVDDALELVYEAPPKLVSDANGHDRSAGVCRFCSNIRHLEKCPTCPEMDIKLTDIRNEYGFCVARYCFQHLTCAVLSS
jgi:hypothetical protein